MPLRHSFIVAVFALGAFHLQNVRAQGVYFRFGNLDTMATSDRIPHKTTVTWSQVLANTKFAFVGGQADWEVKGYHISFQPEGGDYRGPYYIRGNEWTDEIKRLAKEKLMEYPKTRILIEGVMVKGPDRIERTMPTPITFTAEP